MMKATRRAALSEDERLDSLGWLLTDPDTPKKLRVAGVTVLLYAEPLTGSSGSTSTTWSTAANQSSSGSGNRPHLSPSRPLPAADYIADREYMNTATNQASPWPFPDRRAGQPFHPDDLSASLIEIGVPVTAARGAAIRQQPLEMPVPLVADALGYHDKTGTRLLNETDGTWRRYPVGDHTRSPEGWVPRGTGDSGIGEPSSTEAAVRPASAREVSWAKREAGSAECQPFPVSLMSPVGRLRPVVAQVSGSPVWKNDRSARIFACLNRV
ncbi:hypothetical protein [Streptomyces sp. 2131.1]|uniref:hypothetical protein n=1 Tax=Streptomyces sp. 2131.1 TaxID=1855346 RepID=UPI0015A30850|nr:hypothetical protein [Streptomyces sp. 2131.1]